MHAYGTIRDLPTHQRPRERLHDRGVENLTDAELLAIILGTGTRRASALEIAQRLLRDCGGFRGLDQRSTAELCTIPGLGPAKVAQLKAALALGKKLLAERDSNNLVLATSREVYDHVALELRDRPREVFLAIFLTVRNRIITERILFEGTLTESAVFPREVIKIALNESAAHLIFVHNHPSHNPTPSPEDVSATKRLKAACEAVGISVLDHLIIGGERYFSFAEEGLL